MGKCDPGPGNFCQNIEINSLKQYLTVLLLPISKARKTSMTPNNLIFCPYEELVSVSLTIVDKAEVVCLIGFRSSHPLGVGWNLANVCAFICHTDENVTSARLVCQK